MHIYGGSVVRIIVSYGGPSVSFLRRIDCDPCNTLRAYGGPQKINAAPRRPPPCWGLAGLHARYLRALAGIGAMSHRWVPMEMNI